MRDGMPGWRQQLALPQSRGRIPTCRTSRGIAQDLLETEPHVGELSSSSEEGEGLKDTVAETRWTLAQVDALTYPYYS